MNVMDGLHYEVHGSEGPYLLLVHGFLSSRSQWLPNLDALSAALRPVVIELLGHGRSPAPEAEAAYAPAAYVDAFERVRRAVGAERWFVGGQSLGAALTLRYALDVPEAVIGQVFTNSSSAFAEDGWAERVRGAMDAQAARLIEDGRAAIDEHPLNPTRNTRLATAVRESLARDCALHTARGIANTGLYTVPGSSVRKRIIENTVPSLMVVGEREERFAAHRAFALRHMPHLEVVGLDGGHAVNMDAAEEFNAAVLSFIQRNTP